MSAMTKREWMAYIEKTWDAAHKEAWSEPQFECPRCGHCCQAEVNKEAMKLALEALESDPISHAGLVNRKQAITALRQALETEQEPVAWASSLDFDDDDQEIIPAKDKGKLGTSNCDIPLYATPKQWVGLTDQEVMVAAYQAGFDIHEDYENEDDPEAMHWWTPDGEAGDDSLLKLRDLIEAKLKERNT